MKKLFSLLFITGTLCMMSCGPSADQQKKADEEAKRYADSALKAVSASISASMDSTKTMTKDSTKK